MSKRTSVGEAGAVSLCIIHPAVVHCLQFKTTAPIITSAHQCRKTVMPISAARFLLVVSKVKVQDSGCKGLTGKLHVLFTVAILKGFGSSL